MPHWRCENHLRLRGNSDETKQHPRTSIHEDWTPIKQENLCLPGSLDSHAEILVVHERHRLQTACRVARQRNTPTANSGKHDIRLQLEHAPMQPRKHSLTSIQLSSEMGPARIPSVGCSLRSRNSRRRRFVARAIPLLPFVVTNGPVGAGSTWLTRFSNQLVFEPPSARSPVPCWRHLPSRCASCTSYIQTQRPRISCQAAVTLRFRRNMRKSRWSCTALVRPWFVWKQASYVFTSAAVGFGDHLAVFVQTSLSYLESMVVLWFGAGLLPSTRVVFV
jgi:hypothetical protein